MAKFNIEIDTEEESIAVSVDGTALPPARCLYAYGKDDNYGCGFSVSVEYKDESGLRHVVCANKKDYSDSIKKDISGDVARFLGLKKE